MTIAAILAFITSPIGKLAGVLVLLVTIFFAGDIRGRRIEHEKCEAAAHAAQVAADQQDDKAGDEVKEQDQSVTDQLRKDKESSDAQVKILEGIIDHGSQPCLYDKSGRPLSGVRVPAGKGTNNPKAPGPPVVLVPKPRPAGN